MFAKAATIGIYAIIDQVTLEPDAIRISGVFVVPIPMSSGKYGDPERGRLYFRIPSEMAPAARKDWNELKALAGTGQVAGFCQYWVPNLSDPYGNPHHSLILKVRTGGETEAPEVYPLPHAGGVLKKGSENDPDFEKIAAALRIAARR